MNANGVSRAATTRSTSETIETPHGYATWRCRTCGGAEHEGKERADSGEGTFYESSCTKCDGWQPFVYVLDQFADEYIKLSKVRR